MQRFANRHPVWTLVLAILVAGLVWPWVWLGLLIYPAQVLRLAGRMGWQAALLSVLGKFAEAQGVGAYWANRLRGRRAGIIEYK